ncbi:uncharacterized protein LOC6574789 [Drosophila mojavensis]|uniref:Ionotropic glutamate receptor C-terminal domain-containing protein n=1 Tax=Drosophila mojavensis TaxID=7230 RepID=B4K6H8_DROMO|nr:uncharacterized protein LOC6574789 [Drosophila mojavensis]EDW16278.2 uncharacterized protein Dmoj_GI22316 [Drosophila mojavensis]
MRCASFCLWCCCILMLVDGQLKPIVEAEEDNGILISIIAEVDRFALPKNFITYSAHQERSLGALQQSLMKIFYRPVIVAGPEIGKLHKIITDQNLILVFLNEPHDPLLRSVEQSLTSIKDVSTIFVYKVKDNVQPKSFAEFLFNWCVDKGIYNVLLLVKLNNTFEIWTYLYHSDIKTVILPLKDLKSMRPQDYRKHADLGQHRFLVAFHVKLSETFLYKTRDGRVTLGGQIGLMLQELMHYMNGTMDFLTLSFNEYQKVMNGGSIDDRPIDIVANLEPYSFVDPRFSFFMSRICLILPYRRMVPLQSYISYFDRRKTLFTFMIFNFIVFIAIKRIANPRQPLTEVLFGNFRLLVSQALSTRMFRTLTLAERILEVTTHIYNLVTFSIFISVLTMALVTGLQMPDIVDDETFLASGLRIMVYSEQMDNLFNDIPLSLRNRLIVVDKNTSIEHVHNLNDSYAYVMMSHTWLGFKLKQNSLRLPKLISGPDKLCGVPRYIRIHVQPGVFHLKPMKHFLSQAFEAGLTKKWKHTGFGQAEEMGLVRLAPHDLPSVYPLPMDFFIHAFLIYAFGNFTGIVVFLIEWLYFRWNHIRNNHIVV